MCVGRFAAAYRRSPHRSSDRPRIPWTLQAPWRRLCRDMLNPGPLSLCLMIGLAVSPVTSKAIAGTKPHHISGASRDAAGHWQPADLLEEAQKGVGFQIGYLAPEAARRALATALGRDVDLLPGRVDEHRPGYLVFVLQVTNGSSQDVVFNPTQARLATEKGDMKFAMDYSALYEVSMRLGPDGPSLD